MSEAIPAMSERMVANTASGGRNDKHLVHRSQRRSLFSRRRRAHTKTADPGNQPSFLDGKHPSLDATERRSLAAALVCLHFVQDAFCWAFLKREGWPSHC